MADKTYTTIQGDMWDLIAYKVYGHERYMSTLLEANPMLRETAIFPAGIKVRCPDIGLSSGGITPPWKR